MGISKRNKRHSPGGYHPVHLRPVVLNKSVEVEYYKQVQAELRTSEED